MKQVYNDLNLKTGELKSGIVQIQVAPREWIDSIIETDFDSGKIVTALNFVAGRDWLTLRFAPRTYKYIDAGKSNKSGPYREITASGIHNEYNAETQRILDTIRYHELIVKLLDKNKRIRIVGNTEIGMELNAGNTIDNAGTQDVVPISFFMECEDHPPFYEV